MSTIEPRGDRSQIGPPMGGGDKKENDIKEEHKKITGVVEKAIVPVLPEQKPITEISALKPIEVPSSVLTEVLPEREQSSLVFIRDNLKTVYKASCAMQTAYTTLTTNPVSWATAGLTVLTGVGNVVSGQSIFTGLVQLSSGAGTMWELWKNANQSGDLTGVILELSKNIESIGVIAHCNESGLESIQKSIEIFSANLDSVEKEMKEVRDLATMGDQELESHKAVVIKNYEITANKLKQTIKMLSDNRREMNEAIQIFFSIRDKMRKTIELGGTKPESEEGAKRMLEQFVQMTKIISEDFERGLQSLNGANEKYNGCIDELHKSLIALGSVQGEYQSYLTFAQQKFVAIQEKANTDTQLQRALSAAKEVKETTLKLQQLNDYLKEQQYQLVEGITKFADYYRNSIGYGQLIGASLGASLLGLGPMQFVASILIASKAAQIANAALDERSGVTKPGEMSVVFNSKQAESDQTTWGQKVVAHVRIGILASKTVYENVTGIKNPINALQVLETGRLTIHFGNARLQKPNEKEVPANILTFDIRYSGQSDALEDSVARQIATELKNAVKSGLLDPMNALEILGGLNEIRTPVNDVPLMSLRTNKHAREVFNYIVRNHTAQLPYSKLMLIEGPEIKDEKVEYYDEFEII